MGSHSFEMNGHSRVADFAWMVGSLAKLHRLPFDPALLLHRFPPPHDLATLTASLASIGCSVTQHRMKRANDLRRLAIPYIAFLRAAPQVDHTIADCPIAHCPPVPNTVTLPGSEEGSSGLSHAVLVAKTDGERMLYFPVGSDSPRFVEVGAFLEQFEPLVLMVEAVRKDSISVDGAAEDAADANADAQSGHARPFGFRWFVPELLKHRRIWRDVLIASLVIQLLGLGIPLFTQIVIDKVVVNQTLSTLMVVGVGMAVFIVFSMVMTWIRQYLVIHTGNRIDAVLGSKVFAHLLRLPHLYFQHRPTGTLVARMHGIETIREFITGAAVALLLDLPFMIVFLAVMFLYSWQLALIAVAMLFLISVLSLAVAPTYRTRLNEQFLLGARNQAFVTEYVAGMETVKSLQLEP
ncbi:MAG: ABC transporter transmembrane domain-containing protein, partial [Burkholderiales bacterium]